MPKTVLIANSFGWVGVPSTTALAAKVVFIRDAIANGTPLPTGYYRAKQGARPDAMLARYGVMHLHLTGNATDDELLLLMQFRTVVMFLEITNHNIFQLRDKGAYLRQQHEAAVTTSLTEYLTNLRKGMKLK